MGMFKRALNRASRIRQRRAERKRIRREATRYPSRFRLEPLEPRLLMSQVAWAVDASGVWDIRSDVGMIDSQMSRVRLIPHP